MIIDIYNKNEISPYDFYSKYVLFNKPCIIKNFYNKNDKCYKFYLNNKSNFNDYLIFNVSSSKLNDNCFDNFTKKLCQYVDIQKNIRGWKHNKDNLTRWHYDGNGINVINICITGKKKFYLSPPGSLGVFPFTNTVYLPKIWNTPYVTIYERDFLYIPSYWFHQVITEQDNTFTINYCFYHKNNNDYSTLRDRSLYTLHNLLSTSMCKFNICNISKLKNENILIALLNGLYEISIFFLLFSIIIIYLYKLNKNLYKYFIIILTILNIFLFFDQKLDNITYGVIKLFSFYFLIYIVIIHILIYTLLN